MKVSLRLPFNHHLFLTMFKKRKAYGVSSLTKDESGHWLFFDIDTPKYPPREYRKVIDDVHRYLYNSGLLPYHMSFTPHGLHVFVPIICSTDEVLAHHVRCPHVDVGWSAMGFRRKYWFLETRKPLWFNENMRYMCIERKA